MSSQPRNDCSAALRTSRSYPLGPHQSPNWLPHNLPVHEGRSTAQDGSHDLPGEVPPNVRTEPVAIAQVSYLQPVPRVERNERTIRVRSHGNSPLVQQREPPPNRSGCCTRNRLQSNP